MNNKYIVKSKRENNDNRICSIDDALNYCRNYVLLVQVVIEKMRETNLE